MTTSASPLWLGIDLGTSGVKAVLLDEAGSVATQASAPLSVSRSRPLWSEQNPEDWWRATGAAVTALRAQAGARFRAVAAIGLSGQMHGATLLGPGDGVLRPAILWNDGRSHAECEAFEAREPRSREISGNRAMPGFTAPKLLWVKVHEPEIFARTRRVLLPKDWLRLRMTGEAATDVSDASGTLWLDVARRKWSPELLAATDLDVDCMPRLHEGPEESGRLRAEVAAAWGLPRVPVAAGGGDQAAGAVGVGVVRPGEASLSLGTSGVLFVADDRFRPHPERAVHAFCHAVPGTWHQMGVLLSAASCLSWVARLVGARDETTLLAELEAADAPSDLLFLPYLSGERTPHDDPHAKGVFFGLHHDTGRPQLGRAVLEGVAFAFADARDALVEAGASLEQVSLIGGGARSPLWARILASVLEMPLAVRSGGDVGPALGAARLARLCTTHETTASACPAPPAERIVAPDPALAPRYRASLARFRELYARHRDLFRTGESQ